MKTQRRANRRRGTSAVEFAYIAPLFFLLVIGMIEFSRALMVQQVLTSASREGARTATLDSTNNSGNPSPTTIVDSADNNCLAAANVSGATTTISPALPVGAGQDITVTGKVPYSSVSWIPSPWFLGGATLTAVTVMRRETTQ